MKWGQKHKAVETVATKEINDLTADYLEFCRLLKEEGELVIPPISAFAIWRQEEYASEGLELHTTPLIN